MELLLNLIQGFILQWHYLRDSPFHHIICSECILDVTPRLDSGTLDQV